MSIFQDWRMALRALLKSPSVTVAAITMLALGTGATTTIFSVINGVLLRPLAYKNPDRLVAVWLRNQRIQAARIPASGPNFADWCEQSRSFEAISWYINQPVTMALADPEQVPGCIVPIDFFDVLGVLPARGRLFARNDPSLGMAVLSWAAWERRFGKDPNVIGRKIETSMGSQMVLGVLPNSYRHPALPDGEKEPEIWILFDIPARELSRDQGVLALIGRLKTTVSIEQAQTEMAGINDRLTEHSANKGVAVELVSLMDAAAGRVRRPLWLLFGGVGILLLCACVNVANLLLARSIERQREFAIRAALGSSRARAFRQAMTEGLLLSVAGATGGLLLAKLGAQFLTMFGGMLMPRSELVKLDGRAVLFTAAVSLLTGIAFACVPVLTSSPSDLHEVLKSGGRAGSSRKLGRTRSLLVSFEVALALVLVAGAALLTRSFRHVLNIDMGYAPSHVLTAEIPDEGSPSQNPNFLPELLSRIRLAPGVESAGAARTLPLSFDSAPMQAFDIVGGPSPTPGEAREAVINVATPGYFQTMGIALRRGRLFSAADTSASQNVALVNEAFVRRYSAHDDPIGKTLDVGRTLRRGVMGSPDHILHGRATIVGVIADVRQGDMVAAPKPQIWNVYGQRRWLTVTLAIRTHGDPGKLAGILRSELRAVDRAKPLTNIRTADEYYAGALAQRRVSLIVMGFLALVALLLSALGEYGVIAYFVTRRLREVGIRMALGAQRGDLIWMIVRQGLTMTLIGLAVGVPAALAAARLLESALYEIKPYDPATFAGIALSFIAVAAVASYLPARRATQVSPIAALRFE